MKAWEMGLEGVRRGLAILLLAGTLGGSGVAEAQARYTVTEIAPPAGNQQIVAADINNAGQIAVTLDGQSAGIWENGVVTVVGQGVAQKINNLGQVLGRNAAGTVTWQKGQPETVTNFSGVAVGFNDKGEISGFLRGRYRPGYGVFWKNGVNTFIPSLTGDTFGSSLANGLNNLSQVVGYAQTPNNTYNLIVWQNGKLINKGGFGYAMVTGYAINDKGQIVANAQNWNDFSYDGLLLNGTSLVKLGRLNTGDNVFPVDISNNCDIIGDSNGRPFVWSSAAKVMEDLNALLPAGSGWSLAQVTAINDQGWIVGNGSFNGVPRAFVLQPLPVPTPLPTPPTITISDASVVEDSAEGSATMDFTVSLSAPYFYTVAVDYKTVNGTALASEDYLATPPTTLRFAPGQTTQVIRVPIVPDSKDENNETLKVSLSKPINATLARLTAIGIIADDDAPPSVSISGTSVGSTSVAEGAAATTIAADFTVSLSAPSGKTIRVCYATKDGSATAGTDYVALPLTVLTFAPGEVSKSVAVTVNGDDMVEPDETFTLTLSRPSNVTLSTASTIGTILNDDSATSFVPADNYSGTYSLGIQSSPISIQLLRATYAGYEGITTVDGNSYSCNLIVRGSLVTINIFSLDANSNQICVATIDGQFSPDGSTISGIILMNGQSGTVTLGATA